MKKLTRGLLLLVLLSLGTLAPVPSFAEDCMECHGDKSSLDPVTPGRSADSLLIPANVLQGSVHEDLECSDCHGFAAEEENSPHYEKGGQAPHLKCRECHDKAWDEYSSMDIHGKSRLAGDTRAPTCHDCHGSHQIKPLASPDSNLSPLKQPDLCGQCHGTEVLNETNNGHIAKRKLVERYKQSVHWGRIQDGQPAATCSDCHGHHSILPSSDPNSRVTRVGLLTACAKCHKATVDGFAQGSHGRTLLNGNLDVPTCTTCHGDHDIISLRIQSNGVRHYAATQICIWCHGNERMMGRYGLDTTPVESYMRDFHGLAQRGTSGTAATCTDCHDAHRSLPESHPESRMHLSNRGTTCGKCHGTTNDSFIMSFSHKNSMQKPGNKITYWIKIIYLILILTVIGGMFFHNLLIWLYFAIRKTRYQQQKGVIRRLNRKELAWHWIMLVSFTMLILTGFMLSYSDTVVFQWIYDLGFPEKIRAFLHRFFAILLAVDMVVFLAWTVISRHGRRKWWLEMFPRPRDVKDLFITMSYYLGRRKEKPRYAIFNYAEKAEYWALLWGTAVMILSGIILWFSELLPPETPPWLFAAARVVHFYEAVLAGLAILVWHFFHTIFHPEEYPLGPAFMTGRLTEHEAEEKFTPEAIKAQTPKENLIENPMPPKPWLKDE